MIYPIVAYGHPVLRRKCENVALDDSLKNTIQSMYETMDAAKGVGLAAPQIGLPIRLFIIDNTKPSEEEGRRDKNEELIREVFINAQMIHEDGRMVSFEEGCLSIPNIFANVERPENVRIRYYNSEFKEIERDFTGFSARIIQHEYDHIEGILFIDKIKPIKRTMIKRKLDAIKNGSIQTRYKMKFATL